MISDKRQSNNEICSVKLGDIRRRSPSVPPRRLRPFQTVFNDFGGFRNECFLPNEDAIFAKGQHFLCHVEPQDLVGFVFTNGSIT